MSAETLAEIAKHLTWKYLEGTGLMSIYSTLWSLKFPRFGDYHTGCQWVEVLAQGVPAHIGTPTQGYGYESGDPYGDFLPPPIAIESEVDEERLRAVAFVTRGTPKGTERSGQEYRAPLLVISGIEYMSASFGDLHERICSALRGARSRAVLELHQSDGTVEVVFEDGSRTAVPPSRHRPEESR